MYRVFSFSMIYRRRDGRMITEPDALDMIYHQSGYKSFLLTNSWGEYTTIVEMIQAVRGVPKSHYQHYLLSTAGDGYEFLFEGVVVYEDDRPYLVFNMTNGGGS